MKTTITILALSLTLAACGGGESDPTQCRAAIVTAGISAQSATPEATSGVPAECVFPAGTDIFATVDAARAATGKFRVHMLGVGTGAAQVLDFMDKRPGYVDYTSLWFVPADTYINVHGSIIVTHLNGPACEAQAASIRAAGSPATCAPAAVFDAATARADLNL